MDFFQLCTMTEIRYSMNVRQLRPDAMDLAGAPRKMSLYIKRLYVFTSFFVTFIIITSDLWDTVGASLVVHVNDSKSFAVALSLLRSSSLGAKKRFGFNQQVYTNTNTVRTQNTLCIGKLTGKLQVFFVIT